jgi:hypothetical protein
MAAFAAEVYLRTLIVGKGKATLGVWPPHVTIALTVALIGHVGFQISLVSGSRTPFRRRRELAPRFVGRDGNAKRSSSIAPCEGRVHDCSDCNVIFFFGDLATW